MHPGTMNTGDFHESIFSSALGSVDFNMDEPNYAYCWLTNLKKKTKKSQIQCFGSRLDARL